MDPGRLDRRVTLHEVELARSSTSGSERPQLVQRATVWAQVTPIRGGESFGAQQRYAEVTHRFRIRHRRDITPEWVVEYDGRLYDLVEVLEVGRREGLDLLGSARAE